MAKPRKKKRKSGRGGKKRPGAGSGAPRRRKKRGPDPIKSMALGAAIVGLIALFFMMPIAGDTPFNHVLKMFRGDSAKTAETKKKPEKSEALPARRPTRAVKFEKAPPLEKLSATEQKSLDDLIDSRRTGR